ncbi:MAG: glutamate-1-semialdehyde 2,1-aminomutase [Bacteroidia bacterium]|nr:glutamate-1-semialdehyde 2,1-aminomutase [Bacteroidia bacterium]
MIRSVSNRYINSNKQFELAKKSIPGGVNSPVRAFKSVGGIPVFMQKGNGANIYDIDGNEYIDYVNSWGPMILGYNHPKVIEAMNDQVIKATTFGTPTEIETELANLIKLIVPSIDLIRFVSSGTEACMTALRLARGYTKRNKFIKFSGCYHGHADPFLVQAGSGLATLGIQNTPGVPSSVTQDTLIANFNDISSVEKLFYQNPDEIAAVIIEPIAGNMGCVPPNDGFLEKLREICTTQGTVLIFDEVMTGFRISPGGVQQHLEIEADLVTYGKVIGGGLPVGAFAGKKEIMSHIAPLGNVYQAGTLSGNPLAIRAGLATLSYLNDNRFIYDSLEAKGGYLKLEIGKILTEKGLANTINQVGSMISVAFHDEKISSFSDISNSNISLFNEFFHYLLDNGVYLPPSVYETWFLSNALEDFHLDKTLSVIKGFKS